MYADDCPLFEADPLPFRQLQQHSVHKREPEEIREKAEKIAEENGAKVVQIA